MQMKYGLLLFRDSIFLTENLAFLLDSDPLILFKSGIITIYLFILGPLSSYSMAQFDGHLQYEFIQINENCCTPFVTGEFEQ